MKGMIFTEFLEMVEDRFGYDMLDQILEDAKDPEEGSYTAINYYSHGQLVNLVVALSKRTGVDVVPLMKVYGEHLFGRLVETHRDVVGDISSLFELLHGLEEVIHREVRIIYPDSNPPKFEVLRHDGGEMELKYTSHRSMAPVAEGLIQGCAAHFGEEVSVEQIGANSDGTEVTFLLRKTA